MVREMSGNFVVSGEWSLWITRYLYQIVWGGVTYIEGELLSTKIILGCLRVTRHNFAISFY